MMTGDYLKEAERISGGDPPSDVSSLEAIPWLFPVGEFALWVTSAQAVYQRVSSDVMVAAVEQLHEMSLSVHEMVPPFEPLFADGNVDLKIAAKTLVDWPRKSALGKGCSAYLLPSHRLPSPTRSGVLRAHCDPMLPPLRIWCRLMLPTPGLGRHCSPSPG